MIGVGNRQTKKLPKRSWTSGLRRLTPRRLGRVLFVAAILFVVSGYMRGIEFDARCSDAIAGFAEHLREYLAVSWVRPHAVGAIWWTLSFAAFAAVLFLLANFVRTSPSYVGSLVLCEFIRRQGRDLSALGVQFGLSLPIALAVCLFCHGQPSFFGWLYFLLGQLYIQLSCEPKAVEATLNWFARIRTGIDFHPFDSDSADPPDEAND